ncbi:Extradiol ring-cleavage dioxygenase, class III enzyme, subunit B [Talaromyces proteolyticus]|uniref:Extradiol ring-cleavage dioxygenase, class III enzyme, subunit B n=1 Tax=Talaromyces proteolyticus TaxID=1131652 RepID=A0AAD4KZX0_9EURO|nr:Extradiol ring-cleavage dioxygenase, class III enzyme, subunit B [Talaromyces proteolyticus]KAH8701516.1 Extradiol ring-cleavage dioxygenase, class III enzyme, subunit B [Talaromyces proteolyticus]
MAIKRAPSLFISHGAGPFAILGSPHQQPLVDLCKEIQWVLDGAKGVIVVTAHWETDRPYVSSALNPELYYDYFDNLAGQLPREAFEIKYPGKGDPELAQKIKDKLDQHGLQAILDDTRGWDHGVWVPMILLRPQADIPIVQVSIPNGRDEATEPALKLGRALAGLRDEGYIILGSGSSYHNFNAVIDSIMGQSNGASPIPSNRPFEDAMDEVAKLPDANQKAAKILKWREEFPDSEAVQPVGSSEHFVPFIVNIGAAGNDVGRKLGEWDLFGTIMSFYMW